MTRVQHNDIEAFVLWKREGAQLMRGEVLNTGPRSIDRNRWETKPENANVFAGESTGWDVARINLTMPTIAPELNIFIDGEVR